MRIPNDINAATVSYIPAAFDTKSDNNIMPKGTTKQNNTASVVMSLDTDTIISS